MPKHRAVYNPEVGLEEGVWMNYSNSRTDPGLENSRPDRAGSIIVTGGFCMLGNPTQNIEHNDDRQIVFLEGLNCTGDLMPCGRQ